MPRTADQNIHERLYEMYRDLEALQHHYEDTGALRQPVASAITEALRTLRLAVTTAETFAEWRAQGRIH